MAIDGYVCSLLFLLLYYSTILMCCSVVCSHVPSQGAAALTPGDAKGFKALLRTLPIESALTNSTPGKSPPGHNHSFASTQHGHNSSMNRTASPFGSTGRSVVSSSAMF